MDNEIINEYRMYASAIGWDGICRVCRHNWADACHGDCTCLGCNGQRQEFEKQKGAVRA